MTPTPQPSEATQAIILADISERLKDDARVCLLYGDVQAIEFEFRIPAVIEHLLWKWDAPFTKHGIAMATRVRISREAVLSAAADITARLAVGGKVKGWKP